jgi:hypothetical protein
VLVYAFVTAIVLEHAHEHRIVLASKSERAHDQHMDAAQITVEKRTIYSFGKRKSVVFDACQGEWSVLGAPTRKAAIAALIAERDYVTAQPSLTRGGCTLKAHGLNEWCFRLPSGGSMCFGAADWIVAYERVVTDYGTHEDCQGFFHPVAS